MKQSKTKQLLEWNFTDITLASEDHQLQETHMFAYNMSETLAFELMNEREVFGAFQSFCRIWVSKCFGSLSLETSDGNVVVKFEQHLLSLQGLRPGPVGRQSGKQQQNPGVHKTSRQSRREKRAEAKASAEKVIDSKISSAHLKPKPLDKGNKHKSEEIDIK